jgi:ZIP family zinc transporter
MALPGVAAATGPVAPLVFGLAASAATLAGGLLGLRLASRIVLVLGVTAGIVLGVALFDLLPEALALGAPRLSARGVLTWVAVGLGGYMLVDRLLGGVQGATRARWRAHLGPATLTLHSFTDGLGIGIAFQVSPQVGWLVALAVLTHDVADGVNTVSLCVAAERHRAARVWLLANGAAPLLGVTAALVIHPAEATLAPLMAVFAGLFLYIGAGELLPRSHALDPRPRTTLAAIAGMALMATVTAMAR